MRLRYHNANDGILILEMEPQFRSLYVRSQTRRSIRVPLPYLYFVIRYEKIGDLFAYHGVHHCGLGIFGSLKSIKSLKDKIFYLPTDKDPNFGCYVCTDHNYDHEVFNSIRELVNFVIGLWYGSIHQISYPPFLDWTLETLDNLEGDWCYEKFNKLIMPHRYGNNLDKLSKLDECVQLINEKW